MSTRCQYDIIKTSKTFSYVNMMCCHVDVNMMTDLMRLSG